MDHAPERHRPDPAQQLLRDIHNRAVDTLRGTLPPPSDDTPKVRARREHAALAGVASLMPATAAEADLAARHVAADIPANDCLSLAGQLRAQAASMGREARGTYAALRRMQSRASRARQGRHP